MELERARVALVHDWLNQLGGAENVLEELVALFPRAPIYTSMYAPRQMPDAYRRWSIHTSFMQRLPGIATHHQPYMPAPLALEHRDAPCCRVTHAAAPRCPGLRSVPVFGDFESAVLHPFCAGPAAPRLA